MTKKPQTTRIISRIHAHCDTQTQDYSVGTGGVISIERFNINGIYEMLPRLRVSFDNGHTVEMDEQGMTIYEDETQND